MDASLRSERYSVEALAFTHECMERYLAKREAEMLSGPSEWVGHTRIGDSGCLMRAILEVYGERVERKR